MFLSILKIKYFWQKEICGVKSGQSLFDSVPLINREALMGQWLKKK